MTRQGREFEKLVARIEEKLCQLGAKVTSPDHVPELVSGRLREVDASIRYQLGSSTILITIECRDRNAAQDVTWLEQVKAKRDNIGANQTIAVSKEGFSDGAKNYAKQHGIELRQLSEVTDAFILQCMKGTSAYTRDIRCQIRSYNIGYFPLPEDEGLNELNITEEAREAIEENQPFAKIRGEDIILRELYLEVLPDIQNAVSEYVDGETGFNATPYIEGDADMEAFFDPGTLSVDTVRGKRFINVITFGIRYKVINEALMPFKPMRYTGEGGKPISSFSTTSDANKTMRVDVKFGWDQ